MNLKNLCRLSFLKWTIICFCYFFIFLTKPVNADTIPVPSYNYTLVSVSSDNESHPAAHAWDAGTDTWWALYNSEGYSLPGTLILDLGESVPVCGFSYLPNSGSKKSKPDRFEFYVSADGTNWGDAEVYTDFDWQGESDVTRRQIRFGAVDGRYIKLVYLTNTDQGSDNIHTSDFVVYKSSTASLGKENQQIVFDKIEEQIVGGATLTLQAHSDAELPVQYEVISGPATIEGTDVVLSGESGKVTIRAYNDGNETYYATEMTRTFKVTNLADFSPTINCALSPESVIELSELRPYPIYFGASIAYRDQIDFTSVTVNIGGIDQKVEQEGDGYFVSWEPDEFTTYDVTITVAASNGKTTIENYSVEIVNQANDKTIRALDHVLVNFPNPGRTITGSFELPFFLGNYKKLTGHFITTCPNIDGACDDWDRWARLEVKGADGRWIEIVRYITPYGVGCSHEIDLTDYMSVLQGKLDYRLFIDTWGTGGWEVTFDLEYDAGTPEFIYSYVDVVWDGTYDFGNPLNLQSVEKKKMKIRNNVRLVKLNLVTTGHGWGANNTGNAAEFYHARHHIHVDGASKFEQDLWVDCDPNPDDCQGQKGTWYYNRAGWCPGAIAERYVFDLSDYMEQDSIELEYIFDESYVDHCHPNSTSCVSGSTCDNCNDGYNPHYHVDGHLISQSNNLITSLREPEKTKVLEKLSFDIVANPNDGNFKIYCEHEFNGLMMFVYDISGQIQARYAFNDNYELTSYQFNLAHMGSGIYFVKLQTNDEVGVQKMVVR
ncbi:T9SS type A sorting domain-containing protein [Puteibacter caeruleilacunae]|nr:T9SS type A sorting domain-containing protein [Puteibacter caeruleilacunae]